MKSSVASQAHKDGTLPYAHPRSKTQQQAPRVPAWRRGPSSWCSVDVCAALKESGDRGQEGETARRQHVWAEQPITKLIN